MKPAHTRKVVALAAPAVAADYAPPTPAPPPHPYPPPAYAYRPPGSPPGVVYYAPHPVPPSPPARFFLAGLPGRGRRVVGVGRFKEPGKNWRLNLCRLNRKLSPAPCSRMMTGQQTTNQTFRGPGSSINPWPLILLGLIIAAVTLRRTGANDTWYSVFIVAIIFLFFVFLQDLLSRLVK